ncbi:Nuclease-related domain protein [Jeotgalicoccus saudimassiliensis]|uniref:Nuclease-related domain protein n=1 Tax=Jeotgalicoccus saudimassiliensis TaxID=1461582 RepID=A0A078LZZ0_9STAP|nr:nuclease-related domain-containing protein [Jeotgalicoccus saudimassiliensis]CDZ99589.1 Nuclease-related domain protein [Jeotgalicoccus saudimassiliensis]
MYLNDRNTTPELLHYRTLERRLVFDKGNLRIYENGFLGECLYDKLFDEVGHDNLYIFRDVYLTAGKSGAQYDSIIISGDNVTVNEIKNYSGEYSFTDGRLVKNNEVVPDNPFTQVDRAVSKLYRIFRGLSGRVPVEITGKVIFPNDDFRLYSEDHSIWKNVVIRMDMKKYFRQFKGTYNTDRADRIISLIRANMTPNPYFNGSPDTARVKKGLYCGECGGFELKKGRFQLTCTKCGTIESNETHLLRAMSDHKFLYYNQPMTKRSLLELIDCELHNITVLRALQKHCDVTKKGRQTSYLFKYYDYDDAIKNVRKFQRYKDKSGEFI